MSNAYWYNNQRPLGGGVYTRYAPSYANKVFLEEVQEQEEEPRYVGYYPRTTSFPSYFPAFQTTTADYIDTYKPQAAVIETVTTTGAVKFYNTCYRCLAYMLIPLAILSFGFEVANLAVTANLDSDYINVYHCQTPEGFQVVPWFFTWVAPGIWASIPIFITGILAIYLRNNYGRLFQVLAIFSSLSAFFFAPAIVAVSGAELGTFLNDCGKDINSAYNYNSPMSLKFIFPVIVIIIGCLEIFLSLILAIQMCIAYDMDKCRPIEVKDYAKPVTTFVPSEPDILPLPVALPAPRPQPSAGAVAIYSPLPPAPPPPTGTPGRIVFMETHNRGYAYASTPGYFSSLPQTTNTSSGAGFYWK